MLETVKDDEFKTATSIYLTNATDFIYLVVYLCLKKSFAANLMAFSGVMRSMFTADPLYIPLNPSARYVFLKQSNIEAYIRSPLGPTYRNSKRITTIAIMV